MVVGIFVIFVSLSVAYGTPCSDLSGVWRNGLGSNMTLAKLNSDSFKIIGTYSTSVESSKGASSFSSPVTGLVQPTDGGSLVAFNVLWNHGASLTSWVGQCIICDGKEILYTTWILRSYTPALKKWMAVRINQDTFWRLENDAVPSPTPEGPGTPSTDLLGLWTAKTGDSFNISFAASSGIMEGELLTPVENGGVPVSMFGSVDGNATYTALGFAAATTNQIRGWTAHIYNQAPNRVMETAWLGHSFSDSCIDPRRFVSYGMYNYTQPIIRGVGSTQGVPTQGGRKQSTRRTSPFVFFLGRPELGRKSRLWEGKR